MAQTTNFFLGANSGDGLQSLFAQLQKEDLYDLMILKGVPGGGKSTFMKRIAASLEQAGMPVEYLWCSGDSTSLDAVRFPTLRCAIVDGTPPHVVVIKSTSRKKNSWTS